MHAGVDLAGNCADGSEHRTSRNERRTATVNPKILLVADSSITLEEIGFFDINLT